MPNIPLAYWRPDVANVNSTFAADVMNVLLASNSYIPFPKNVPFSLAVPAQPIMGFSARNAAGQVVIFVGTASKLYMLNTTTLNWDHVSKLAADQATNGTFAADVSWTKGTNVTISAGAFHMAATPTNQSINQAQALVAGTIYKIVFTVSNYSSGNIVPFFSGGTTVTGTAVSANGTYTQYLTAVTGNTTFGLIAGATTTLDGDNVTIQALANYAATTDERWQFRQYGNYVVAVNVNDNPQVYQIGVSSNFADLAGSPPRARHIAVWGDFLALGGLSGFENRVHWSGLDDITQWTPGVNNCDFQDFPDGADVNGMTDATNPIVGQKSAFRLGSFLPGSVEVFSFQKVQDKRGVAAPYSMCSRGEATFFVDNGSFFQISSIGQITPIGLEKIDRTVFANVSGTDLFDIIGDVDPFFNRVYFAVRYNSTSTSFDRILIYDWGIGEWSQIVNSTNVLFPLASGTVGYTLEGLDAVSASLDALPFSLDSRVWQGGAPVMAAFDANFKLGFYSGDNAEATITTQEFGDTSGMMLRVSDLMPVVDTNDVRVSIGARNKRGDTVIWSAEGAPSSNTGIVRKKSRARFHSFKIRIPENTVWTHAQSLDVKTEPAGKR